MKILSFVLCLIFLSSPLCSTERSVFLSAKFDDSEPQKLQNMSPIFFNQIKNSASIVSDKSFFLLPKALYYIKYSVFCLDAPLDKPAIFKAFLNNEAIEGTSCSFPILEMNLGLPYIFRAEKETNILEIRSISDCDLKNCYLTVTKLAG